MSVHDTIKQALSVIIAMTIAGNTAAATTEQSNTMPMGNIKGMERCFGISKAHLNDCSTALHDCAGHAAKNNDPSEWILLPQGLCNKIVGGKTFSQDEKKSKK